MKKLNDKKVFIQYKNYFKALEISREKITSLVVNVSLASINNLLLELQELKETVE